ncbi:hypothetical protein [Arcanobacterium ihumii]|uniref:hypothetical protein n=1 Tax=Arcanobacterium ihumii TaxID=2138162 RepID=UPI000F521002|nr:hypothetical protein [Arcanobacterium ihumii]
MTTTKVFITPSELVVRPCGMNKVWSLRQEIRVPLANVRGATHDPGVKHEPKGVRAPGLRMGNKLAGTFHVDNQRNFWNVSGYENSIVIQLAPGEHFNQIVVSVDNPRETVDLINRATAREER